MMAGLRYRYVISRFNTTESAVLSNTNPKSKQDTNAAGVSVLLAQRVYITQRSPNRGVKF